MNECFNAVFMSNLDAIIVKAVKSQKNTDTEDMFFGNYFFNFINTTFIVFKRYNNSSIYYLYNIIDTLSSYIYILYI